MVRMEKQARHWVVAVVSLAVPPWNRVGRELVTATPMVVEHLHNPEGTYTADYDFLGFLVVRIERLVNTMPVPLQSFSPPFLWTMRLIYIELHIS